MSTLTWSLLAIAAFLLVAFLSTRAVRHRHREKKTGDAGTSVHAIDGDSTRAGSKHPKGDGADSDGGGGGGGD